MREGSGTKSRRSSPRTDGLGTHPFCMPGRRVDRRTRSLRRRTKIPRYARILIIFFSCGGMSCSCQWYRVCDAGALRAEPLATLMSCAVIIKIRAYRGIFVRRPKLLVRRSTRRPGKPSAGANMRKPRTSAESVLSDGATGGEPLARMHACCSRGHGRNDASPAALTRARALRDGNARSSRPPRQPLSTPPAYR